MPSALCPSPQMQFVKRRKMSRKES